MTACLAFHEKEVYDIMRYLMSQEQITADRLNAVRREGRQEEFLDYLRSLHALGVDLPFMTRATNHPEDEIVKGLTSLGLSIPS